MFTPRSVLRAFVAAVVFGLGIVPAAAQFGPGAGGRAPYAQQPPGRNEAGRFDYYALVLSWSPSYCAGLQRDGYDPQCNSRDGKRFSFVLHGLWPQYDRGWPQDCPVRGGTYVPQKTIDGMLDIMPSPKLVIHEYKKHGTCSGLSMDEYFAFSRKAFKSVKIPARYERPNQAISVNPGELVQELVAANPGLKPDAVAVVCGGPGNRLREVRVCLAKDGQPRDCGHNEDRRKLCSASRVLLPPVR